MSPESRSLPDQGDAPDLYGALTEASNALVEIGKGVADPDPARRATKALIRIAEQVGSDPEPFRIALEGLDSLALDDQRRGVTESASATDKGRKPQPQEDR